jgi:hypothetical protein
MLLVTYQTMILTGPNFRGQVIILSPFAESSGYGAASSGCPTQLSPDDGVDMLSLVTQPSRGQ